MYTFAIILALVGLAGFIVSMVIACTTMSDTALAVGIIFMVVFVIIAAAGLYLMKVNEPITTETLSLVAMYSGQEISTEGRFVVLGGSFISKEGSVYRYYYVDDDGGIRQGTADVKDSVIYEISTDTDPYVEVTGNSVHHEYTFYIPANTNEWSYQLD